MTRRLLATLILAGLAQTTVGAATGYELYHATHPMHPICIQVDPNGAPAPDTCTDPNAYQVGIGR